MQRACCWSSLWCRRRPLACRHALLEEEASLVLLVRAIRQRERSTECGKIGQRQQLAGAQEKEESTAAAAVVPVLQVLRKCIREAHRGRLYCTESLAREKGSQMYAFVFFFFFLAPRNCKKRRRDSTVAAAAQKNPQCKSGSCYDTISTLFYFVRQKKFLLQKGSSSSANCKRAPIWLVRSCWI